VKFKLTPENKWTIRFVTAKNGRKFNY